MAPCLSAMTAEEPQGELSASEGQVTDAQTVKEEVQVSNPDTTENCPHHQPPAADPPQEADPTSTNSADLFCRICHDGPGSGPLLSPCDCTGTLAVVHQICLEQWLEASKSSHCELCKHKYIVERQPKAYFEWWSGSSERQQRWNCARHVFLFVFYFLFVTFLCGLGVWVVARKVEGSLCDKLTSLAVTFPCFVAFILLVFIYTLLVRYFLQQFRTWRATDLRVKLKIPSSSSSSESGPNLQTVSCENPEKTTNTETNDQVTEV